MGKVFENVGRAVTCEAIHDLEVCVETGITKEISQGTLIFGRYFKGLYSLDIHDEAHAEVWTCLFTEAQLKDNLRVLSDVEAGALFS